MANTRSEKVAFAGGLGAELAARLDLPEGEPRAYALFAHCFTCSKNVLAVSRTSRALAARGIAVLRFDFTGLGSSDGEFAHTSFSSNVADLLRAADWLRTNRRAPALLIGHSLGGAAVLAAAHEVPEAVAVATIAAPSEPGHVRRLLGPAAEEIERRGAAEIELAGRRFSLRREFLEDIGHQHLLERLPELRKALLVLHSPFDTIVGIEHARRIFGSARHPKSFVSLDDADHMLTRRQDAEYVAEVLAAWASRYLERGHAIARIAAREHANEETTTPRPAATTEKGALEPGTVLVREAGRGRFQQDVLIGRHRLVADEPNDVGGDDAGPSPYDFLLAGLGACTSMTVRMYADRKRIPLKRVAVALRHAKVHAEDCETCETQSGNIDRIERVVEFEGALDEPTRARLLEIANKCPVHRTLTSEIWIDTRLGQAGGDAGDG